jgi:hypothetical protein
VAGDSTPLCPLRWRAHQLRRWEGTGRGPASDLAALWVLFAPDSQGAGKWGSESTGDPLGFAERARGLLAGTGGLGAREPQSRVRQGSRGGGGWGDGGAASESICRPRTRRAGHQLPAPLSRPDESAQRGHRSPARSRGRPGTDPRPLQSPSPPPGLWEPRGSRWRGGGGGSPHCRDGKTEAGQGRVLPKPCESTRDPVHTTSARKGRGTKLFPC